MIITDKYIIQHIPKTAGTSLKRLYSYQSDKLRLITNHKPLWYLDSPWLSKFKSLKKTALIREPVAWYLSWWNYTKGKNRNCSLTQMLHMFSNNVNEFIINALDLTIFFNKYPLAISEFAKNSTKVPFSHIQFFIPDFNFKAEDFKHKSLYSFYLKNQIDHNFKLFRFDDILDFLDYIEVSQVSGGLPKTNLTEYTEKFPEEITQLIYNKEKRINKIYETLIIDKDFYDPFCNTV